MPESGLAVLLLVAFPILLQARHRDVPRLSHRPNYAQPWTPEEIARLKALLAANRSIPEIAKKQV